MTAEILPNNEEIKNPQNTEIPPIKQNLAELSDSSDDEGKLIRVGNIPLEWYRTYSHKGYDVTGKPVENKTDLKQVEIQIAKLAKEKKFCVYDELNDKIVEIPKETLKIIRNIRHQVHPTGGYGPASDVKFVGEKINFCWTKPNLPKISPQSKLETKMILKLAKAIKNGWIISEEERERRLEKSKMKNFTKLIWDVKEKDFKNSYLPKPYKPKRFRPYEPPPKMAFPGHEESFNPPVEYLFDEQELEEWQMDEPEDRKLPFIPRKLKRMRMIPSYPNLINERIQRCQEIFDAPRILKKKTKIDAEKSQDLIPDLDIEKLRPFPSKFALTYKGHKAEITQFSIHPSGKYLSSCSKDKTIKIFDTESTRCLKTLSSSKTTPTETKFSPKQNLVSFAMKSLFSQSPQIFETIKNLNSKLIIPLDQSLIDPVKNSKKLVLSRLKVCEFFSFLAKNCSHLANFDCNCDENGENNDENDENGENNEKNGENFVIRINDIIYQLKIKPTEKTSCEITMNCNIIQTSWHSSGKYISLLIDKKPYLIVQKIKIPSKKLIKNGENNEKLIKNNENNKNNKNLGKNGENNENDEIFSPQIPFKKLRKIPKKVIFAHFKKLIFVVFEQKIVIYDFKKSEVYKTLKWPKKKFSSISIHSNDEQLIVGSNDRTIFYFDFEMSQKPVRILKCHKMSIQSLSFSRKFPLFATASMDGAVFVFHNQIFDDFVTQPKIVPVNYFNFKNKKSHFGQILDKNEQNLDKNDQNLDKNDQNEEKINNSDQNLNENNIKNGEKIDNSDQNMNKNDKNIEKEEKSDLKFGDFRGILHCEFHPNQPWLFCSGNFDNDIKLFVE